jgi:hypothetical protein
VSFTKKSWVWVGDDDMKLREVKELKVKRWGGEKEITNDYDLWLELLLWAEQSFISSRFNKAFHFAWYFNFVHRSA